jgi:hypothetical protein
VTADVREWNRWDSGHSKKRLDTNALRGAGSACEGEHLRTPALWTLFVGPDAALYSIGRRQPLRQPAQYRLGACWARIEAIAESAQRSAPEQ